jgi:hypothetical protein
MDQNILLFLASLLIVGGLLLVIITWTRRGPRQLNVDYYRTEWIKIERQLRREEESTYQMVIFDADKLLDKALKERDFKGQTMGERMKSANKVWSHSYDVWAAHKLRNKLAHESDAKASFDDARRALARFKQALKDVGAV